MDGASRVCAPKAADTIEYLHVELFANDVIYAEGVTAETFSPVGQEVVITSITSRSITGCTRNEEKLPQRPPWTRRSSGDTPALERTLQPFYSALAPWIEHAHKMWTKSEIDLPHAPEELVD